MNILIDADFIVYKCCAACETEIDYGEDVIFVTSNFSDAYKAVTTEIRQDNLSFWRICRTNTLLFRHQKF